LLIESLSRHFFLVGSKRSVTSLFLAVGHFSLRNLVLLTWWLVLAALWLFTDPDTSLARELPCIGPFGGDELAVTLAGQLTNCHAIFFPAVVLSVWLFGLDALEIPLTLAP